MVVLSSCLAASVAHAQVSLQKLVMDGDVEPSTNATIKIGSSIAENGGRLFFGVTLTGGGVNTTNDAAWLYGDASAVQMLYREGQTVPGKPTEKIGFVNNMSVGPTGWFGAGISNTAGFNQVAVVGKDNKIEIRPVKVGERIGPQWIIEAGLKPGERVVAEGIQRVKAGVTVNPKPLKAMSEAKSTPTAKAEPR